jgi:hypothetical protein
VRHVIRTAGVVLGVGLLLTARPAPAVYPLRPVALKEVLEECPLIFTARVESVDERGPQAVVVAGDDLKGKAPFRRLTVNLAGDEQAKKEGHTQQLLKRIAPELPLVLFAVPRSQHVLLVGYTNGTWFQAVGREDRDGKWSGAFTHLEPNFHRTFKGTTAELIQVLTDGLAGRKRLPAADAKEPPGLGPEIEPRGRGSRSGQGDGH